MYLLGPTTWHRKIRHKADDSTASDWEFTVVYIFHSLLACINFVFYIASISFSFSLWAIIYSSIPKLSFGGGYHNLIIFYNFSEHIFVTVLLFSWFFFIFSSSVGFWHKQKTCFFILFVEFSSLNMILNVTISLLGKMKLIFQEHNSPVCALLSVTKNIYLSHLNLWHVSNNQVFKLWSCAKLWSSKYLSKAWTTATLCQHKWQVPLKPANDYYVLAEF